ncbi:condensation domain protein [Mycobacterium xenopi 3993]|nr:condensation domain protein [Mycobacterium xenopi 3993]
MRFLLLRSLGQAQRFRLILTVHHILMDAWSLSVFFRELIAAYQCGGDTSGLPTPRPYRDYIGWLGRQDISDTTQRWIDYVAPLRSPTILAEAGYSRLGTVIPQRTALSLDRAATTRLTGWAREHGLTLNTVLQFAWSVVLGRLTDRRDVAFGTVVSGRPQELAGVETMVGLFINTVPVVVELRPGHRFSSTAGCCSSTAPPCAISASSDCPSCSARPAGEHYLTRCWCSKTSPSGRPRRPWSVGTVSGSGRWAPKAWRTIR